MKRKYKLLKLTGVIPKKDEEVLMEHNNTNEEFTPRLTLKDVRISWVNGELHRNGQPLTPEQVKRIIINKYRKLQYEQGLTKTLTSNEIYDIIYNDASKNRMNRQLTAQDRFILKKNEIELRKAKLELQKVNAQERLIGRRIWEENLRKQDIKVETDILFNELLQKSTPGDFNLEMYQRISSSHCILAIQSVHPNLTDKQCKLLIGTWIRKGY